MAGSDELRKARETVESSKSGAQVPEVDLLKARLVIATAEASVSKPSSSRKKSKPEAAPEAQAEYSEEDEDEDEADKENVEEHGSGLGQKKTRTTLPYVPPLLDCCLPLLMLYQVGQQELLAFHGQPPHGN